CLRPRRLHHRGNLAYRRRTGPINLLTSWGHDMVGSSQHASTPEQRLAAAKLVLPQPLTTANLFKPTVRDGHLVYASGHVPKAGNEFVDVGKIGVDFSVQQAKPIAAAVALSCLASIKAEVSELSRVRRILKMTGYFATTPEFVEHSSLLNAASEVLIMAFGE